MSPKFKIRWRPSLFKLMLMFALLVCMSSEVELARRNLINGEHQQGASLTNETEQTKAEADPMEPCYLANNRASESLTISESTPVGTVVGEIMVNGDSSANGNIELSIKMPAGANLNHLESLPSKQPPAVGTQSQQHYNIRQTTGSLMNSTANAGGIKSVRDLSNLIDLMPPLSIEHQSKRLILAKKLDRENLDKYMAPLNQQQLPSLMASTSASLTVHIKCQLKGGNNNYSDNNQRKTISASSILIPIHLIVTDENDNWPIFINSPYIIDLNETIPVGGLLTGNEIVAVDNDQQGPLSTIEYSIVSGSFYSDSFAFLNPLDSRSLIVKDNRLLDFESQSKIMLKVMARDQGEPPNWAIAPLYINLVDNDDLNPIFNEDKYFASIKENRPGEIIDLLPKRMLARDGDKTINAPIIYSFHIKTNFSLHFNLDPDLAKLELKKSLPEEEQEEPFCLLIRASQVDNPTRWTLTMISVRFNTLLLAPPENRSGSGSGKSFKFAQSNYTLEVSEAAAVGSTVINLRASLQSETQTPDVVYQLLDNELGYFNLDQSTGRLTLNKSLDYELYRQVSVRILATHEYSNSKLACDITRLNINVINYNDFAPEFSHEQYNFQLSISDLIASFESPKDSSGEFLKRFGSNEELDNHEVDEFGSRALALGQIYCADRDFGDKLTLQLTGSKANLFHLTQQGRLYLPLANMSSIRENIYKSPSVESLSRRNGEVSRISRLFPARRFDNSMGESSLDREYLNYLLGEISNLGRLRLKVVATDDGQPKVQQSTSLIVITIISIDNFIIQKTAPSQYVPILTFSQQQQANSSSSGSKNVIESAEQTRAQQVMMIPATNGKSFVQINPDIMSNLIVYHSVEANSSLGGEQSSLNESSQLGDALKYNQPPPGLLLVDEEGAKLVATNAAMEVYSQQVQEAVELSARQKKSNMLEQATRRRLLLEAEESLWARWRGLFKLNGGADKDAESGPFYWINLSTFIALHLVIVLAILALVSRFRSSLTRTNSSESFRRRNFRFWQATRLPRFLASKRQSLTNHRSVSSILDQHIQQTASGSYAKRATRFNSSDSSNSSSGYAFMKRQQPPFGNILSPNSAGSDSSGQITLNTVLEINPAPKNEPQLCGEQQQGGRFDSAPIQQQQDFMKLEEKNSLRMEANKSSTFVGLTSQQQQVRKADSSNGAVSIVNVTAPRQALESRPGDRRLSKVSANSSSSSSVISLVSMSSSISNKINAAVINIGPRSGSDQATASDASSLDSAALFNGVPASSPQPQLQPQPKRTVYPPPPPPPPPPPLIPQIPQQQISKPFSSPPIEPSPVTSTRRPLPQNPLHVMLRQAEPIRTSAKGSQTPPITSNPPPPPPAPPSQPVSVKTVSPTTSVDRGYESLQSYTSSSPARIDLRQERSVSSKHQRSSIPPPPSVVLAGKQRQATSEPAARRVAASELADSSKLPTVSRSTGRQVKGRAEGRRSSENRTHRALVGGGQMGDNETEDEDFFYYNKQGSRLSPRSDYLEHAYKQQPVVVGRQQLSRRQARQQFRAISALQSRKQGSNDLNLLQHQQQLNSQLKGACGSVGKKQLTWSDQVGMC